MFLIAAFANGDLIFVNVKPSSLRNTMLSPDGFVLLSQN